MRAMRPARCAAPWRGGRRRGSRAGGRRRHPGRAGGRRPGRGGGVRCRGLCVKRKGVVRKEEKKKIVVPAPPSPGIKRGSRCPAAEMVDPSRGSTLQRVVLWRPAIRKTKKMHADGNERSARPYTRAAPSFFLPSSSHSPPHLLLLAPPSQAAAARLPTRCHCPPSAGQRRQRWQRGPRSGGLCRGRPSRSPRTARGGRAGGRRTGAGLGAGPC